MILLELSPGYPALFAMVLGLLLYPSSWLQARHEPGLEKVGPPAPDRGAPPTVPQPQVGGPEDDLPELTPEFLHIVLAPADGLDRLRAASFADRAAIPQNYRPQANSVFEFCT